VPRHALHRELRVNVLVGILALQGGVDKERQRVSPH
jgi:hypothetical protein